MLRRARILCLALAATAAAGCTSTLSMSRGDLLRSTPGERTTTEYGRRLVVDGDSAVLNLLVEECTEYTHEYGLVEHQKVRSFSTTGLVLSIISLAAGSAGIGTIYYLGLHEDASSSTEVVLMYYWPVAFAGLGLGGLIYNLFPDTDYQTVPSERTEFEKKTECRKVSTPQTSELGWSARLGAARREGRTGSDGRLELRPIFDELLRGNSFDELRPTVAPTGFRYELRLGDAPRYSGVTPFSRVSDSEIASWAARYDRELQGPALSRWQSCRMLTRSARDALACHFRL